MKKLLCFAVFAFGMSVQAQNIDTVIEKNVAIKTAQANEDLTLSEKIKVVNDQVDNGRITKDQAYQIITKFSNEQPVYVQGYPAEDVVAVVEELEEVDAADENYDYDWGKETSPFDFAMGVQMDTVVKYGTKTTPYLAFGVGNVATDGAFANSEFGYMRSNYFEWGVAARTPFSKTNNKWGIRYGLGFKYNGLATTQNREFALAGNQTVTTASTKQLRKNYAYFRNTYVTIPISLDFTTTSKVYNEANRRFTTKEGINFGVGGYVGYNINSKQFIRYENADGYKVSEQQKGDWNVNDFQYGLTAYAGKDHFKVVLKYDLSPVFSNNVVDQNYWSIGLQLGL
ncbi:porin family protein [Paenimyroides baculatum]|uniref:PorT family protein n=1 Tax=Paenimyroides baculatum TaxID=2608000 RepID=A0A5M6CBK3_9FLAO|nr:outer membrane beta-barrel protein [Paenimyroides baculatum]KAA5531890.1 PorT family protein [Paenimyroides baculatum]